jgi:hypothetical protein
MWSIVQVQGQSGASHKAMPGKASPWLAE